MLVYILLSATLLLAWLCLFLLWRGSRSGRVLGVVMSVFIYLYGFWLYASVYGRYMFGALAAALLLASVLRKKNRPRSSRGRTTMHVALTVLLLCLCVLYFTGTTGRPHGVANLRFPLHHGRYIVFQGGRGLPTNAPHVSSRGAIYAMDLARLTPSGARASRVFSTRLEDYAIFNDTVFAPCAGTVTGARDDNPDNTPPNRKRGPSNLNAVTISTPDFHVFLGHLKQRAVFVREGDVVKAGDPLGLVGNSGMSIEPHLHIQAHAASGDGRPWWSEEPLLIKFDGEEYRLFEVITPRETRMMPTP